jgi:hypothetical protein
MSAKSLRSFVDNLAAFIGLNHKDRKLSIVYNIEKREGSTDYNFNLAYFLRSPLLSGTIFLLSLNGEGKPTPFVVVGRGKEALNKEAGVSAISARPGRKKKTLTRDIFFC